MRMVLVTREITGLSFAHQNIGTEMIKSALNTQQLKSMCQSWRKHKLTYLIIPLTVYSSCQLQNQFLFSCLLTYQQDITIVYLFLRYLHISGETFGRPISGQSEVSAYTHTEPGNEWKAMVCIYELKYFHCHSSQH